MDIDYFSKQDKEQKTVWREMCMAERKKYYVDGKAFDYITNMANRGVMTI